LDVVFQQKYETGSSDYTSLIEATKATNPDVIIGIPQPPDMITLIKQSAQLNLTPKMWYMHKAGTSQQVNEALGSLAAGIVMPSLWAPSSPFGQDVAAAFVQAQKYTPGWIVPAFAVSTDILWQAIERAGTLDPTAVANVLHSNAFYTTLGTVKFNPDGSFYPAPFLQQMVYSSTANSLGEHIGYSLGPIVYPRTTGCCQSSSPPIVAGTLP
jgi:branched-chain amino acid transport system substrate-binding protein